MLHKLRTKSHDHTNHDRLIHRTFPLESSHHLPPPHNNRLPYDINPTRLKSQERTHARNRTNTTHNRPSPLTLLHRNALHCTALQCKPHQSHHSAAQRSAAKHSTAHHAVRPNRNNLALASAPHGRPMTPIPIPAKHSTSRRRTTSNQATHTEIYQGTKLGSPPPQSRTSHPQSHPPPRRKTPLATPPTEPPATVPQQQQQQCNEAPSATPAAARPQTRLAQTGSLRSPPGTAWLCDGAVRDGCLPACSCAFEAAAAAAAVGCAEALGPGPLTQGGCCVLGIWGLLARGWIGEVRLVSVRGWGFGAWLGREGAGVWFAPIESG